jgi:hypothetical protein
VPYVGITNLHPELQAVVVAFQFKQGAAKK